MAEDAAPAEPAQHRIAALDLLRGFAVLGILAVNIGGFAGPMSATTSPHLPSPGTLTDEAWFAFCTLVFEGKMRALFSLLFGASMLLFIDRADATSGLGEQLQFRRLGWLALFGYLHFLLFWWGDILFNYALAGFAALAFRHAAAGVLGAMALAMFVTWHAFMAYFGLPAVVLEHTVLTNAAAGAVMADYAAEQRDAALVTAREIAMYHQGFLAQIIDKLGNHASGPLDAALASMGETLPLMLLGMALFRSGFFNGGWSRAALRRIAVFGVLVGGAASVAFLGWVWPLAFPPVAMASGLAYWLAVPHLLMALGYAAALLLAAPHLIGTVPGQRLVAAGRMAFSNYLGMTIVMTALFYGWGLDLFGKVPPRWHWPFVVGGWVLMLGWSRPWLARFRQGPLEWAWRSLTWCRIMPLRR